MKSYEISVSLPFSWCRFCTRQDLETSRIYADDEIYETENTCKNAEICEACERARKSEQMLEEEKAFNKSSGSIHGAGLLKGGLAYGLTDQPRSAWPAYDPEAAVGDKELQEKIFAELVEILRSSGQKMVLE